MNAHTTLTADGNIPIPDDVRERMGLTPGMDIEIDEARGFIRLKPPVSINPFPRTTLADIDSWEPCRGTPKTIEEISSLSDDALRQIFAEQNKREQNASD